MLRRLTTSIVMGSACLLIQACKVSAPGNKETASMSWFKHNVTVGGKNNKNPIQASSENIRAGQHAFGYYCVVCHGRDGQNTGVPFASSMSPPVPSLAAPEVQTYSDGQLKWIIENGLSPSGMPASKATLSDEEMWQIVVYLRHLPPAGSLGEPKAYSEGDTTDEQSEPSH